MVGKRIARVDELRAALGMGFYYDYLTITDTDVVMSELLSRLAPLPRKDVLRVLSSMAAWVSRPGNVNLDAQRDAAKAILPLDLAKAYESKLQEDKAKPGAGIIFHLQQIRFVLQWAVICCGDHASGVEETELRETVATCCVMASRLLMKIDETVRPPKSNDEERELFELATYIPLSEVYRYGLVHERAAAIWFGAAKSETVRKATGGSADADIAAVFERKYEVPLREFFIVLTKAWVSFNGHNYNRIASPLLVDVEKDLKAVVRADHVDRSLKLISQDPSELEVRLLGTRQSWSTDMTPFVDRPLIELEPGKLCCPDLFMLQHALIDRVASLLQAAYPRGRFEEVFGYIYEEYLHRSMASFGVESDTLARTYFHSPHFVGEEKQAGDGIYDGGDVAAVFEAKVTRLTPRQKYGGGPEEVRKAIVDGLGSDTKGTGQLAKVLKGLMDGKQVHVGTSKVYEVASRGLYYPVLVVLDEVLTANTVRKLLQGELEKALDKNKVDRGRVAPLMIFDTRDIEFLAGVTKSVSLPKVLSKYAAYLSKMEPVPTVTFESFLHDAFPEIRPEVDSPEFEDLKAEILRRVESHLAGGCLQASPDH